MRLVILLRLQVRMAAGHVVGFVLIRCFSGTLHSRTLLLNVCDHSFNLFLSISSDSLLGISGVGLFVFVPFALWCLVDPHAYRRRFVSRPPCRPSMSICHYPSGVESMYHRASRIAGPPNYILYGLRHGPASKHLTVYLSPGFPLCRASHICTIRPPA